MTDQQTPEQIEQEANAAMDAGYSGAPVEQPKTEEPKVEAPAVEKTTEAKPEQQVDEWEGVPQNIRTKLEAMHTALQPVAKISERFRNFEGQVGGLQTKIDHLSGEIKAAVAQKATTAAEAKGGEAPSKEEVKAAFHDPERMKQLKEDFPDWAEAFETEIGAVNARIDEVAKKLPPPLDTSALRSEVTGDVDKRIATAVKDAEMRARTYAYLDLKHGTDWQEQIASPQFEAWFAAQPKDTQDLSASDRVTDASKLLASYEAHQKKQAEKAARDKRLERAEQPEGVQVTTTTEDAEAAFERGYAGS